MPCGGHGAGSHPASVPWRQEAEALGAGELLLGCSRGEEAQSGEGRTSAGVPLGREALLRGSMGSWNALGWKGP